MNARSRNSQWGVRIKRWTQGEVREVKLSQLRAIAKTSKARISRVMNGHVPCPLEFIKAWRDCKFLALSIREVCRVEIERMTGAAPALVGSFDADGDGKVDEADVRALDLESIRLATDSIKRPRDWAGQEQIAASIAINSNTRQELLRHLRMNAA